MLSALELKKLKALERFDYYSLHYWLTKKPDRFSTTGLLSKLIPVTEQIICQKHQQPGRL